MCKHELEDLMGVAGGVVCRKCGAKFDHIPKQDAPKAEPKAKEAPVEEKPKRTRKPAAKKGDK